MFNVINTQIAKIYAVQAALFGEFSDVSAIIFSLGVACLVWLLTSFKQTESARFTCLIVIVINLFCERQLQAIKLTNIQALAEVSITQFSRTLVLLILAYLLKRTNSEYIDYEKENSQLLNKVVNECVDSTRLSHGSWEAQCRQ